MKVLPIERAMWAACMVILLFVAGCSGLGGDKITEPYKDAPRGETINTPADIRTAPDGFNNSSGQCDRHGNRVFTLYHGDKAYGGIAATRDPSCPGYLPPDTKTP